MVRDRTGVESGESVRDRVVGEQDPLQERLAEVYGDGVSAEQEARYRRALEAFAERYGPGPVSVFRAPGRVNLIGEHTDYNHGYVLPVALDRDIILLARRRADAVVNLGNLEGELFGDRSFAIGPHIPARPLGDWGNYVQGAAQRLCEEFGPGLSGMDAWVDGAPPCGVPREAGLSSSSALTVVAALALAELNELQVAPARLALLAGEAEWYVGTRGGIMDQFISLLGQRDHALFLDCRPRPGLAEAGGLLMQQVPLPPGYRLVVADSGVRRQNTRSDFNLRVAECRLAVALLKAHYPGITHLRDVEWVPWQELEPHLPEQLPAAEVARRGIDLAALLDGRDLGPVAEFRVRARSRHVYTENARVCAAVSALQRGDASGFGRLMDQAHASARDDYQVSTPELEALVDLAHQVEGVLGARLTGAGWGGCIVALVAEECAGQFAGFVAPQYQRLTGRQANVFVCRSGMGACLVAETCV